MNASDTGRKDLILMACFIAVVAAAPILFQPIGAGYPDLLQKFAIFGIFATGFNILFGLTGYLSFGHAAFLGIGSYTAVWSFKLLGMSPIPAVLFGTLAGGVFAFVIGIVTLRRAGIYFSILTLAFAQMSYNLAYSVLTPITNGETGLRVLNSDPRLFDDKSAEYTGSLVSTIFGIEMNGYPGYYFCALLLVLTFYFALRLNRSPFGMKLRAIKSNQNAHGLHRLQHAPVSAGGLRHFRHVRRPGRIADGGDRSAGGRRAHAVDGLGRGRADDHSGRRRNAAGSDHRRRRHQVLREHLLGVQRSNPAGDLRLPARNRAARRRAGRGAVRRRRLAPDAGRSVHAIVIFLPGGLMEGFRRIARLFTKSGGPGSDAEGASPAPAE
jgi:ABC-type uncharacterized transport system permease subunit